MKEFEDAWLEWIIEVHVEDVIKTGYFNDWQIQKLLIPETVKEESIYVINYTTDSIDKYYKYIKEEAARLQKEHTKKFEGKFRATRAVYRTIPE